MLHKMIYVLFVFLLLHCREAADATKGEKGERGEPGSITDLSPQEFRTFLDKAGIQEALGDRLGISAEKLAFNNETVRKAFNYHQALAATTSIGLFQREADLFLKELETIWNTLKVKLRPLVSLADDATDIFSPVRAASMGLQVAYASARQLFAMKMIFDSAFEEFGKKIAQISDQKEKTETTKERDELLKKIADTLKTAEDQDIEKRKAITLESLQKDYLSLVQVARADKNTEAAALQLWGRNKAFAHPLNTESLQKQAQIHYTHLSHAPLAKVTNTKAFFSLVNIVDRMENVEKKYNQLQADTKKKVGDLVDKNNQLKEDFAKNKEELKKGGFVNDSLQIALNATNFVTEKMDEYKKLTQEVSSKEAELAAAKGTLTLSKAILKAKSITPAAYTAPTSTVPAAAAAGNAPAAGLVPGLVANNVNAAATAAETANIAAAVAVAVGAGAAAGAAATAAVSNAATALTPAFISNLNQAQITAIDPRVFSHFTGTKLHHIQPTPIAGLTATQIAQIPDANVAGFAKNQIAQIPDANVAGFTVGQIPNLTQAAIQGFTAGQIPNLTIGAIGALTDTQIPYLSDAAIGALTGAQIPHLSDAAIGALTDAQIPHLSDAAIGALTDAQIPHLTTAAIGALTAVQIPHLTDPAVVQALTATQIEAFTTKAFMAFNNTQIGYFTVAAKKNALMTVAGNKIYEIENSALSITVAQNPYTTAQTSVVTATKNVHQHLETASTIDTQAAADAFKDHLEAATGLLPVLDNRITAFETSKNTFITAIQSVINYYRTTNIIEINAIETKLKILQ